MISETWVPERRYGVIPHDPVSVTTRSCITDPNERAGNRDTQDLSSGIEGTRPVTSERPGPLELDAEPRKGRESRVGT